VIAKLDNVMAGLVPAISIPEALSGIEVLGTRPRMTLHGMD
jgi:hypothetical protein